MKGKYYCVSIVIYYIFCKGFFKEVSVFLMVFFVIWLVLVFFLLFWNFRVVIYKMVLLYS